MNVVRRVRRRRTGRACEPEQLTLAKVDPEQLDFWTLKERIAQLGSAGRPADEARPGYGTRFPAAFDPSHAAARGDRGVRTCSLGQVLLRATHRHGLGFAYFVADNFSIAMGNVGAYPPFLAAWAPFLLFLLVGETVLIRCEE
jgi:lipopolysaccharide export system permease protein